MATFSIEQLLEQMSALPEGGQLLIEDNSPRYLTQIRAKLYAHLDKQAITRFFRIKRLSDGKALQVERRILHIPKITTLQSPQVTKLIEQTIGLSEDDAFSLIRQELDKGTITDNEALFVQNKYLTICGGSNG